MKAPLTRLAVVAFSLALVGSMALTTHATGTSGNSSNGSQQSTGMSGCCGGQQSGSGQ